MSRKIIIGVMGGAAVPQEVYRMAYELGALIADQGWALLNGGRNAGVMRASAEGAKSRNGLTIGVLPGAGSDEASPFIDIAIVTNMGDARNVINVLSGDVIVVCPGRAGTISEAALALKSGKPVIFLGEASGIFEEYEKAGGATRARTPQECIKKIKHFLEKASI